MGPRALEGAFEQNLEAGSERESVEEESASAAIGIRASPGEFVRHVLREQPAKFFGIDANDPFEEGGQPRSIPAHSRSAPAAPSASFASFPSRRASAARAVLPDRVIR